MDETQTTSTKRTRREVNLFSKLAGHRFKSIFQFNCYGLNASSLTANSNGEIFRKDRSYTALGFPTRTLKIWKIVMALLKERNIYIYKKRETQRPQDPENAAEMAKSMPTDATELLFSFLFLLFLSFFFLQFFHKQNIYIILNIYIYMYFMCASWCGLLCKWACKKCVSNRCVSIWMDREEKAKKYTHLSIFLALKGEKRGKW